MYRRYYNRYDNYPSDDGSSFEENNKQIENNNLKNTSTYLNNNPYRINAYNKPEIIVPESSTSEKEKQHSDEGIHTVQNSKYDNYPSKIKRVIGKFDLDDIILLALIVLLILEDCDDYLLIAVLAFVFITGWEN
jgi:hypothetical protein